MSILLGTVQAFGFRYLISSIYLLLLFIILTSKNLPAMIIASRFLFHKEEDGNEPTGFTASHIPLFSFAMEASVGIFMGQTSMQDRDLEQADPKCSAYSFLISPDFERFLEAAR